MASSQLDLEHEFSATQNLNKDINNTNLEDSEMPYKMESDSKMLLKMEAGLADDSNALTNIEQEFKKISINKDDSNDNNNDDDVIINDYRYEKFTREMHDDLKRYMHNMFEIYKYEMNTIFENVIKKCSSSSNNNNFEDNSKHKKIKYSDDDDDDYDNDGKKALYKSYDDVNVIVKCNVLNFGKIVGRNGFTLKHLEQKFEVKIIVPPSKDVKDFPHILVIDKSSNYNYNRFNKATEAIIRMLNNNNN